MVALVKINVPVHNQSNNSMKYCNEMQHMQTLLHLKIIDYLHMVHANTLYGAKTEILDRTSCGFFHLDKKKTQKNLQTLKYVQ